MFTDDVIKNQGSEKQPLLGENPKLESGCYESSGDDEVIKQSTPSLDLSDGGPLVSSQETNQKDHQRRVGAVIPPANGVAHTQRSGDSERRESYQHSGFIRSHSALQTAG